MHRKDLLETPGIATHWTCPRHRGGPVCFIQQSREQTIETPHDINLYFMVRMYWLFLPFYRVNIWKYLARYSVLKQIYICWDWGWGWGSIETLHSRHFILFKLILILSEWEASGCFVAKNNRNVHTDDFFRKRNRSETLMLYFRNKTV